VLLSWLLAVPCLPAGAPPSRPSVLVHCPRPSVDQWSSWVDLRYLAELHARGFEVDYTDRHADFSWERVRRHDVLVLYSVPLERGGYYDNTPDVPPYRDEFVAIVERFLEAGGGVLLLARSINADETFLPLIGRWDARIPRERIVDSDPRNVQAMPRMSGAERLLFTDNAAPGPLTAGVRQVWLPASERYAAAETMPIEVGAVWRVVLRGSRTSRTVPIDAATSGALPPPDPRVRAEGVPEPPLFAVRDYRGGRIAFGAIWPEYSIGQGTEWLYERRVLSAGIDGRPSDFGSLLENALRWLAEPARAAGILGGFVTDPERLVPPNERAGARERFARFWRRPALEPERELAAARDYGPIHRGLIGAQTEIGSGRGSVADHARAARRSGLSFVVFLEDFARLDPERLERLKRECARNSGTDLRLWPGYRIETNTGNRMFVYGDGATLPPPVLVVGGKLNLQFRDPVTGEHRQPSPLIDWINYRLLATGEANVGYYGFADRPQTVPLDDLRLYSAAALRLYEEGAPVEDNLEAYLASAAGTIPPLPLAVHLLASPEALERAGRAGVGLTRAQAPAIGSLWRELGYAHAYAAPHVFVSDGPTIHGWPQTVQVYTFGAERFVGGAAFMPVPVVVRSDAGLKEIRIYDGDRLFRRFLPRGARSFERLLQLTATVQRTLVLVAEDVAGRSAVSAAWRAWRGGALAPVFCGDRVNHCRTRPLLAKGPGVVQVTGMPEIVGGHTWDGGPRAVRPILDLILANRPTLVSDLGTEGERGFRNRALVELSDESAVRTRAVLETLYDEGLPVVDPWQTFGPPAGPSRLFRAEAVFTGFERAAVGPHPDLYAGLARYAGAELSLFEEEIEFRGAQQLRSLVLFRQAWYRGPYPLHLVHGRGERVEQVLDLSPGPDRPARLRLPRGDWIGCYATGGPANLAVLWNRGEELELAFHGAPPALQIEFSGAVAGRRVTAGERLHYELLGVVDPLDAERTGRERVLDIVGSLHRPDGFAVRRGRSAGGDGLVDLVATDGAVTLEAARATRGSGVPLPVRVQGLNPRWSAAVVLHRGDTTSGGGRGEERGERYAEAGFDREGRVYATLFPDRAPQTVATIGHPVVADHDELFVQVTRHDDRGRPASWHVSANNPTDRDLTATFRVAIDLPGLRVPAGGVAIPAGGYVVLPAARDGFPPPEAALRPGGRPARMPRSARRGTARASPRRVRPTAARAKIRAACAS